MKKGPCQDQAKTDDTMAKNDTKNIQEKMKKVDVKSSSATSLLAKNAVLLPSGVARVKQFHDARAVSQMGSSSSGSATAEVRQQKRYKLYNEEIHPHLFFATPLQFSFEYVFFAVPITSNSWTPSTGTPSFIASNRFSAGSCPVRIIGSG